MMQQPLPCPFCGSTNILIEPWRGSPTKMMVGCDNDECYVCPMVSGETREAAVERWNIRAPRT